MLKGNKSRRCYNGSKDQQWAKWANLGGLFALHSTIPSTNMLEEFLHTRESIEDGWIQEIVCGETITIGQALIA